MNAKLNVSRIARNYGTLFAYIIMLLVFSILAPSAFPTLSNVISILRQIAMLATISLGLTFVLITKRSDLSIGYSTSFLGIVVAALLVRAGMNIWLAALITVLLGALIGLINGVVIAYLGVPDLLHLWESVTWWLASIRPIPKATPSPISRRTLRSLALSDWAV